MAPLGSIPRRRGQLCSLQGPGPGPEARVLLLGLRDSLKGSPGGSHTHSLLHGHRARPPTPRSGSGRLSKRPTLQAALTPHRPRPTQPVTHSARDTVGRDPGRPQTQPSGASGRTGWLADRPRGGRTDRRTVGRMSEQADPPPTKADRLPQRITQANAAGKCVCADRMRTTTSGSLCVAQAQIPFSRGGRGPGEALSPGRKWPHGRAFWEM